MHLLSHHFCFAAVLLLVGLSAACQKTPALQDAAPSLDSAHTVDAEQLAADGAGPVQLAMGNTQAARPMPKGPAFVTQTALVRREAKDTKDVEVPGSKKRLSNFTATLYRGEQVEVVQTSEDWVEVRTSDEKTGWLKLDNVLRAEGVEMATVVNAAKVFTRPDLLAFNGARTIMPGTLLFALRIKDQFSEVNLGGGTSGWVLTDVLVKDKREVDVAKLINKARLLKDRNDPSADGLLDLAKAHFADTHLVQTLLLAPAGGVDPNNPVPFGGALPQPAGPEGLGAPGVVSAPPRNTLLGDAPAQALPAGMPTGGVDTAPSAPAPTYQAP
jgi:hypothetical protein